MGGFTGPLLLVATSVLGDALPGAAQVFSSPEFDFVESFNLLKNSTIVESSFSSVKDGAFRFFMTTDCLQIIHVSAEGAFKGDSCEW
jgi:hypothetical protein